MSARRARWIDVSLFIAICLALWQSAHALSNKQALPSPGATLVAAFALLGRPDFLANVETTLYALLLSVIFSMFAGVCLGLALGCSRRVGIIFEPIFVSLYSLPKVTLYPLVLLIFGLGVSAKVAFGVMHGFIPVSLVTMTAIRQIPAVYGRAAKAMRLSNWDYALRIVAPAIMPDIVTALRLGFSLSLVGVVIGEMFASKQGVGFMVMNAIGFYDLPTILAIIAILGAFALSVNALLLWIGDRLRRQDRRLPS